MAPASTHLTVASLRSQATKYWPELLVALVPLVIYWQLTLGIQVMYWGLPSLQFVPWRLLVNQAFAQGHLPLWTPLLGMGAPILANYQSAPFYPPNWLAFVLPPEVAVSLLAVLHLSVAGLGMVRLARRLGLNEFGVAIAGLAFGFSGYLTGRLWFITINNAIAWLPWIVLYTPLAQDEAPRLRHYLILVGLISLQLLAGHAQSTFYTLLLAAAWSLWQSGLAVRSASQPTARVVRELFCPLFILGLACLFAIALAAIQLIPTYELLSLSPRASAAGFDFATAYSLWPWRLFTFLIPNLFGHPADHNFWGYATFWEDNAYLGILPSLFALYSLYVGLCLVLHKWWPKSDASTSNISEPLIVTLVPFCLITIAISIILAFGKNTPVFPFFYYYVPGFNLFQAPARMLIWYTFAVSLLAGLGAHLWQASDRKRYWSRLGIAGSLAVLIFGVAASYAIANTRALTFATALVWTAGFSLCMFVLLLFQSPSPRWQALALTLVLVDVGWAAVRATPITDRGFYQRQPAFATTQGRLFEFAADEYRIKFGDLLRFQAFDLLDAAHYRDSLLTDLNVLSGLASVNNFDPLLPARYSAYLKAMESSPRLLDLADVSAIALPTGTVRPRTEAVSRMRTIYDGRTVHSMEAALTAITDPTFNPDQTVILETPTPSWVGLPLDPNPYTATVTLEQPGYVVLSDTYYPGWRASVDGTPQPILIADVTFRAVAVPAGTHTVTFDYAPFSVSLGLGVSIIALLAFIAVVFLVIRQNRRTASTHV